MSSFEHTSAKINSFGYHPLKSGHYQQPDSLTFDGHGMFGDRGLMIVEAAQHEKAAAGTFLSQRKDPLLAQIHANISSNGVTLSRSKGEIESSFHTNFSDESSDTRLPVSLHGWRGIGIDQGDNAARWLSSHIERPVRLVRTSEEYPRFVENSRALGRVGFADGYPITIATTDAFSALDAAASAPLPQNRPRANIVLSDNRLPYGLEQPDGYDTEDFIDTVTIHVGGMEILLSIKKACERCILPNTDQDTGIRDKGSPFTRALSNMGRAGYHVDKQTYGEGRALFFTQNATITMPKEMEPTDTHSVDTSTEVEIAWSDQPNWQKVA